MGRHPRGLVADRLVEITTKTIQDRYLLRPSAETKAVMTGIISRAQKQTGMRIVAGVVMSNHLHFLLVPHSMSQLAKFMGYVKSKAAVKVGKLVDWEGTFWKCRYKHILVWEDEADQVARLRYVLEHGAKENLVARPCDWPGLHVVHELMNGCERVEGGIWHNRSDENEARRLGRKVKREDYLERGLAFELTPLPCWAHLKRASRVRRVRKMVASIEKETRRRHKCAGTRPLGVKRVLRRDPLDHPDDPKRSYAPAFHALTREGKAALWAELRAFVGSYREAVESMKAGLPARFPAGCFPPGLPYVPEVLCPG